FTKACTGRRRLRHGSLACCRGVGCGQIRLEPDRRDVVDPRPSQPVLEVGLLEVAAEGRRPPRTPDATGVDHGYRLACEQTRVSGLGVELEDEAGLRDDVDELL